MTMKGLPPLASLAVGRWLLGVLVIAVAYYAAARLGLLLAFAGSNASPVWPPSGIALAAVSLFGLRLLPGVALGALAANVVVFASNNASDLPTLLAASLAITVGNSLEALVGVLALRRWIGERSPFERLADVAKFIVIALGAPAISAVVGTATLLLAGIVPASAGTTVALTWWTGDATGILVVAPLLMAVLGRGARRWSARQVLEALLLLLLVALLGAMVFAGLSTVPGADRRLVWLFMPCIAWAALRHGPQGVAGASLLISGMAVWGTTRGFGPFAKGDLNDALIVLQTFVGLCAVTGLVLVADRRERQRLGRGDALRRALAAPWLVLLGCLGVAVLGWHVVASDTERRAQERFAFLAADIQERIVRRMAAYEQVLRGAAGLFAAAHSVERGEWKAYVERLQLERNYPDIQAVGFAQRLLPTDRDAHVRQVRAEGYADYALRPAGEREEYTSIVYIEPFDERNRRAFGYDMLSEPVQRAAMELARDSGRAALSGKVTLVQETESDVQAGVLMYLPIYRNGASTDTVVQRRDALLGFVYSPFRMSKLMRGVLRPEFDEMAVRIYSGGPSDEPALLFNRDGAAVAASRAFASRAALELPGQPWSLQVDALPAYEASIDRQKAQIVLIAGVGISLLLFALVRSLTMTRERAELLAEDMTAAVRESEAKFRSLAESAGEAIVIADGDGRVVSFNRAAQTMFGHAEVEVIGQSLARLMPPRFRDAHSAGITRMRETGEARVMGRSLQLVGLAKDGSEFPIELSLASWQTAGGRFFSGIIRDITERERTAQALRTSEQAAKQELTLRIQADADLAAKNEALLRSNTELAQFAYVASHDLQEPLRTVASYSQLLLRRHRGQLSGEAQEFLDFIGDAAKRAQVLIDDLLGLARLDSNAVTLEPVALQAVLDDTRSQLERVLLESGALLTHDVLPTVPGDRSQLVQLLQNLVGNAIKFHGAEPPRVHVGARREPDGAWRLSVSDNGIGIDARFHERIFTLFQRLHRAEYPGTGIGLAICKKVVERHGGRIWVESTPGRGATFFFTISAQGDALARTEAAAQHAR